MKKFFAGVSVLAAVVVGLAGCSGNAGVTRESVQQKLYDTLIDNIPEAFKQIPDYEKVFECMSEKAVADFDDKQLADFNELLGKDKEEISEKDVPDEFKSALEDAAKTCQDEYVKDAGK